MSLLAASVHSGSSYGKYIASRNGKIGLFVLA